MSLNLDKRRRAMLREMGIRVWQPDAPLPSRPPDAMEAMAERAGEASASAGLDQPDQATMAPVAPVAAQPVQAPRPPSGPPAAAHPQPLAAGAQGGGPQASQASWHIGPAQALYSDTVQVGGARWLVLAEATAASGQKPAFDGDAGKLLANMLRAARLHQAGAVLFAPLVRHAASGTGEEFAAALAAVLADARPDVVLVMGRLAALALLPHEKAFGKLRGQAHALHGVNTIITYDAPYLLRTPADKAKAWDDLCLAMSLVTRAA